MTIENNAPRTRVWLKGDVLMYNDEPARLVMKHGLVMINCHDITAPALLKVAKLYTEKFTEDAVIIQCGTLPVKLCSVCYQPLDVRSHQQCTG